MDINLAKDSVLSEFPKLKQPFELDSDGLFFLEVLVSKIIKSLVDFYNDYELLLGGHETTLKLENFKDSLIKTLSLPYFLNIFEEDISKYLDSVCEHHKISDNEYYMSNDIYKRTRYISLMLMQKKGIWPIHDYFIMDGTRQIPKSDNSQDMIKSILFEIISLLNYTIDIENGMTTEFISECLINFYKIIQIFKIYDYEII